MIQAGWRLGAPLLVLSSLLLVACGKKAEDVVPERAVRTVVLEAGEAAEQREYSAEVRARTESRLAFRVPGKVLERKVGLGDAVKKGQTLMRLDPADLKLAAEAAQAQLRAAKSNRDSQAADMKRFRELHAQGFISAAELERRNAAYEAAVAQFDQARAQARAQANQADYGVLEADAAGVITSVDAEPGTVVAAGTPVLRLAHQGPRDVVFQVPESQVVSLRELAGRGQLRVRGVGMDQALPARLRELAQAADPATRTFLAKADVGVQPELRIGQTATVLLSSEKVGGIVKLPMAAVFEAKGVPHVFVLDPGTMTLRARAIEVGRGRWQLGGGGRRALGPAGGGGGGGACAARRREGAPLPACHRFGFIRRGLCGLALTWACRPTAAAAAASTSRAGRSSTRR
jgi:multidrug efflux system membrane fusion protein